MNAFALICGSVADGARDACDLVGAPRRRASTAGGRGSSPSRTSRCRRRSALPTSPSKWRRPPAPILCAIGWQSADDGGSSPRACRSFSRAALRPVVVGEVPERLLEAGRVGLLLASASVVPSGLKPTASRSSTRTKRRRSARCGGDLRGAQRALERGHAAPALTHLADKLLGGELPSVEARADGARGVRGRERVALAAAGLREHLSAGLRRRGPQPHALRAPPSSRRHRCSPRARPGPRPASPAPRDGRSRLPG